MNQLVLTTIKFAMALLEVGLLEFAFNLEVG